MNLGFTLYVTPAPFRDSCQIGAEKRGRMIGTETAEQLTRQVDRILRNSKDDGQGTEVPTQVTKRA